MVSSLCFGHFKTRHSPSVRLPLAVCLTKILLICSQPHCLAFYVDQASLVQSLDSPLTVESHQWEAAVVSSREALGVFLTSLCVKMLWLYEGWILPTAAAAA